MSINITNGANISDAVDFTLTSDVDWDCIWFGTVTPCHETYQIVIASGELGWPKYTITVPPVVDGAPLAFVRHPFQLTAISSLDAVQVKYNFTLEPDEWFQAEFDSVGENFTLDPGLKIREEVLVRNTGNSPAILVARLVPLGEDGQPINGATPALSFQQDGWLVGLFDIHHLNGGGGSGLGANGQATIDIEIQAPSVTSAELSFGVLLWSEYNPSDTKLIQFNANISWIRGGSLSIGDSCNGNDVLPDESCSVTISVTNDGNFEDTFEISVVATDWLKPTLTRATTIVAKGETQNAATLTLEVEGMVPAFSRGYATISLKLNSGTVLATEEVELRVGPKVDWELHAIENSTDSRENVSVAFTLRNLGNGDDGLQVSLHVDMSVGHGFIPPEQATHGSNTGTPRFFEIDQIPPGVNFTFRAWMHKPRNTEANGTLTMTVEMQSVLSPDIKFVNETKADYLAEVWRPENIQEDSTWMKIEIAVADLWNQFNGLVMTILVVLAGSLGLLQALKHRSEKDALWKAKLAAAEPPTPEKPQEWMDKFENNGRDENKGIVGNVIQAPKIAARVFQDLFTAKAPAKSVQKEKPSEALLDAANTVLEHHETSIEGDLLDDLAGDLAIENKSHPANELFGEVEAESGRTVRKPKNKSNSNYLKPKSDSPREGKSVANKPKDSHTVSTPAVVEQDEEFDLDL